MTCIFMSFSGAGKKAIDGRRVIGRREESAGGMMLGKSTSEA